MKTYTEDQQKANLEEACKALEANPKKAKGEMRDDEGGRCCLCVMEDCARSIDSEIRLGDDYYPHKNLSAFYGLENCYDSNYGFCFRFRNGAKASEYNDGTNDIKELTHKEIAARIREDFLSSPKR